MSQYWFRPKKFGYGMEPASWEGWLATLVLVVLMAVNLYFNGFFHTPENEITTEQGVRFLLITLALITLFFRLVKDKCSGKIKWNWGKIQKDEDEFNPNDNQSQEGEYKE